MRMRTCAAATILPLLLAGCGSSDEPKADTSPSVPEGTPDGVGDISEADEYAIEQTMTDWFFAPRCDLATDAYLIRLMLFDDEDSTVEEACDELKQNFIEPQYDADDIVYSDLEGEAASASITVGSELANITTTYQLVFEDGTWKISADEYHKDDSD